MKRILIYILILLFGIGIGYVFNNMFQNTKENQQNKKVYINKIKNKIIKDTVFIEKEIYIPPEKEANDAETNIKDTVNDTSLTTIYNRTKPKPDSEIIDTNEVIISETMIDKKIVFLSPSPIDSTDVEALLGVESDAFANEIIVEFWQSPLELTGYALTRNKLKLFGFNPDETFSLQLSKDKEHLFLNTETLSILLEKTEQFKNLSLK